ncbi:hypothetical protein TeGR_g5790 [Tetraparma gracilis]|uniref:Uncharacterized protein n=1 Tax=Tetraparma gracilis TaxID=2962635 RepID=A0ABQ6M4N6_9STRA|nr:hypothetical protein TeGR_g5790 [Tetraparma gracilis]
MATRRNTAILAPAPHRLSKQASAVLDLAAAAAEAAAEAAPPSLYSSPVFHGYSLWLCPAGEDLAALSSLIQGTARRCGTAGFVPHLTVLAGMNDAPLGELLEKMDAFERRMKHNFDDLYVPEMDISGLGGRDLFFQSVYAVPAMTPTLATVNRTAVSVFGREGNGCGYDAAWMPHLSLVYGDLGVADKARVMSDLAVSLVGHSFSFGSLQLWSTEGLHEDWRPVRVVDLPLERMHADEPGEGLGDRERQLRWASERKAILRADPRKAKPLRTVMMSKEGAQRARKSVHDLRPKMRSMLRGSAERRLSATAKGLKGDILESVEGWRDGGGERDGYRHPVIEVSKVYEYGKVQERGGGGRVVVGAVRHDEELAGAGAGGGGGGRGGRVSPGDQRKQIGSI